MLFKKPNIDIYSYLQKHLLMYLHLKHQQNNSSICLQVGSSMEGWSCERHGVPLVMCTQSIIINTHVHTIQYQLKGKVISWNNGM